MAQCKYTANAGSGSPYAILTVNELSQNIANNTSTIGWDLKLYRPYNISSSANKSVKVIINGATVVNKTVTIGGSGTKTLASGNTTISHNADGSKSINFSFSLQLDIKWNGIWVGTGSASGSMALKTIPRSSTISGVNGNTIGSPITINIARHASFTHQLWYKIGSSAWFDLGKGHATSCSFTPDLSKCTYITTKTSDTLQLCIRTYSGSTQIGNDVYDNNYKINVPSSVVPTISNVSTSEAVAGLALKFGRYVQGKSKINVKTTAAGAQGSTIKSYSVAVDGATYSGADITTNAINSNGTVSVAVTVTDSRGRTATRNIDLTFAEYSPPIIHAFSVVRANSQGQANAIGTYASISLNFNISPVASRNNKSYQVDYKKTNDTAWTNLGKWSAYSYNGTWNGGNILNEDNTYIFRVTVSDYFDSVTADTGNVSTAFTLINFHRSGNSLAFGGVSERADSEKAIDFKMKTYDRFGTEITNGMAEYTGSGASAIDPNTTTSNLIITDMNTPTGELMYIQTTFYGNKTPTANRAQIAQPYNTNGQMYYRQYFNGSWGPWKKQAVDNGEKILWQGGMYMTEGHIADLTESISSQPNGIVLVFSEIQNYSTVIDAHFSSFFVSKYLVSAHPGKDHYFSTVSSYSGHNMSKRLKIFDTYIEGFDNMNGGQREIDGVVFSNKNCVMRYVYGV